ncbi:GFA family protein [Aquitalea sp. ASV15]|uniref:GFA family protein n=1 Tax=Aquitalea sp. ASV15 TaxID=2795104 RepID=UPI0018ED56C3
MAQSLNEVDQLDLPITHCHCLTCQKAHAAPFVPTAGVLRQHFRWLRGEDQLGCFQSSPGKLRHFCRQCGSHLLAEREGSPHVILRVATLDEAPAQQASQHIWTSHTRPWLEVDNLPHWPEWPPGR